MRQQVKPWPNGLESRRKLKTWVYLRPCLTRVCVHLRWLAQTLVEFKFASKSTQDFHRLATQPKSTQVEWRIISQWNTRYVCRPGNVFFCDLRVPVRKRASPFGHPTQVSTQVQLASTCDYLPVRLARALTVNNLEKKSKFDYFSACCHKSFEPKYALGLFAEGFCGWPIYTITFYNGNLKLLWLFFGGRGDMY